MSQPLKIFTTLKVRNQTPIALMSHLEKLSFAAQKIFGYPLDLSPQRVLDALKDPLYKTGVWRLNIIVSSSVSLKITPYQESDSQEITLKTFQNRYQEPFAFVKKLPFKRHLFLKQARLLGYDDYIFLSQEGEFLETSVSNLFWIKGNTLYTPCPSLSLYSGCTLSHIIIAAQNLGLEIKKVKEKRLEKLLQSFVFICNSMKDFQAVSSIDEHLLKIDPNLMVKLQKSYELVVEEATAL